MARINVMFSGYLVLDTEKDASNMTCTKIDTGEPDVPLDDAIINGKFDTENFTFSLIECLEHAEISDLEQFDISNEEETK